MVIASEFPSWQDEKGESKGGLFLFKLGEETKGKGKGRSGGLSVAPKELKVRKSVVISIDALLGIAIVSGLHP